MEKEKKLKQVMLKTLNLKKLNFLTPFFSTNRNEIEIAGIYCGDLLSDVIANANTGQIWLTAQKHINIIAVAAMKEFPLIVICNGYKLDDLAIEKSKNLGILAYYSNLDIYKTAINFYKLLGEF